MTAYPNFNAEMQSIMARLREYLRQRRNRSVPPRAWRDIKPGYDKRSLKGKVCDSITHI